MVPNSGLKPLGTQEPWVELMDIWIPSPLGEDPIYLASPGSQSHFLSLSKTLGAVPLSGLPGPCTHLLPRILFMLPTWNDSSLNSSICHSSPANLSSLYSLSFYLALSNTTGVTHNRPIPHG